jgi:quinol monooxygenase YgiN
MQTDTGCHIYTPTRHKKTNIQPSMRLVWAGHRSHMEAHMVSCAIRHSSAFPKTPYYILIKHIYYTSKLDNMQTNTGCHIYTPTRHKKTRRQPSMWLVWAGRRSHMESHMVSCASRHSSAFPKTPYHIYLYMISRDMFLEACSPDLVHV